MNLGMMHPMEPKFIKHTGRKVKLPKERTRRGKDTTKNPNKFEKRGKLVNRAYWKEVAKELIEKALDLATRVETVEVDLTADSDTEEVADDCVEILLLSDSELDIGGDVSVEVFSMDTELPDLGDLSELEVSYNSTCRSEEEA